MKVRRKPLAALSILLVAVLAGCYEIETRVVQTVDETWSAEDLRGLDLRSVNGRVEIRGGNYDQVRVRAEVRASHEIDGDVIRFTADDGVLQIREKWRGASVSVFPFKGGSHGAVRYEIDVPANFELDLDTTNGRVETNGVRGDQSVTSVNGRITVDTPSAKLTARTVNGRIQATFSERFQGARLKTVNGSVKVYVPIGTKVSADVDQVNGSFNSRLPVVVNAVGGEGVPLKVTTVNGSVTLDEVEPPSDAEIELSDSTEL